MNEMYKCPCCNGSGIEIYYNDLTYDFENMTCTICWGNLEVDEIVYNGWIDEYEIETKTLEQRLDEMKKIYSED